METKKEIFDFINGEIILIDKPYRWTSFDVVKKIRKLISYKYEIKKIKVGHAGTLDPLATGLIIVCTGKMTKKISVLQSLHKEYVATIKLGETTPSFDLETEKDRTYETSHITRELVENTLSQFTGVVEQIPPIYSAKLINGKRAYEYARKGDKSKIPDPSKVEIYSISTIKFDLPELELHIKCGKGTYIRSLARDIGEALQSGGHLTALRRTAIGHYCIDDALSIEEFEKKITF